MKDYTLRKEFPLTEEQNQIIDFMLQRPYCINAAQTGFGKTYSGCTALCNVLLRYPDTHAVILAPQRAMKAFKKELTQKLRVSFNELSSGTVNINPAARISVITHTSLKKHLQYISDLKASGKRLLLLVDEAHILSSNQSKIYQYVAGMRHLFSVVWFMTATPLKNNIEGIFHMMYMLNPKIFGSYQQFKQNYLVIERRQIPRMVGKGREKRRMMQTVEDVVGYKNLDQLRDILAKYVILKQKHYNLKFYYHKTDLKETEVKPYLEASEGLCRETAEDNFAVRVHDLQMVVDNIEEKSRVVNSLSSKETLFLKVLQAKMKLGCPTLVYCDYTEVVERLGLLLKAYGEQLGVKRVHLITGAVTQKEREKVEELIDPGTVVLLTSAGTESINLQKADSLIFYDIPFSILTFIQAVGRVTRIDSKFNQQHIHLLECKGTIDSYKRCLVDINGGLIASIFGNIETLPLELCKADRYMIRDLKRGLLWASRQGRLLTDEELESILKGED